ncbi:MAG: YicC family protein [Prevotella sp.]|nr:YicC family protein [Bacteroides sp.]MCM1366176.1 YicC family protein [Prevotella sp.]MCM1436759.1 YicC family protein [Prevotella sp.]
MLKSMTGFGRGNAASETKNITVEIKSLNSKQLDLMMRVPSFFREAELEIRQNLAEWLRRGKVDLIVTVENIVPEASQSINTEVLKSYKEQICRLGCELDLPNPTDWYATLLRLPDALTASHTVAGTLEIKALHEATNIAINALNEFRTQEGKKLESFFAEKIRNIASHLEQTEKYEAERVPKIRKRLEEQLEKLSGIEYDCGRLEQELIFYIEKLDVNEEKQRLRSHLNYFIETMQNGDNNGCGKKLGFIAQEMGREINTLGSKSNNAEMQRFVVMMKDELEQIKEQVLNVL